MTFLLIFLLSVLAGLTAVFLTDSGWMTGCVIGIFILVPSLFVTSLLFARLIDLDGRIKRREKPDRTEPSKNLEQ